MVASSKFRAGFAALLFALSGCTHRMSGPEMLNRCWRAQSTGTNGAYAIALSGHADWGLEGGGIFSRTSACPHIVMMLVPANDAVEQAFERARDRGDNPFMIGFSTTVTVRVRKVHTSGLDVTVDKVGPIRLMSEAELRGFLTRFHL